MNIFKIIGVITVLFFYIPAVMAQDALPSEAKAMARKAMSYIQKHGKVAAFAEFNNTKSEEFIDRDLYVFALDRKGVFLAHPIRPSFVGQNVMDLQDVEGNYFIRKFFDIETEGWVAYQWSHPVTREIRQKKSYIINMGDYVIGVGVYYKE